MKKHTLPILVICLSLAFTFLFYNHPLGLNLLIFEMLVTSIILFIQRENPRTFLGNFAIGTTLVTAISYVINYTAFSLITNIISFFILTGVLIYPEARSLVTSIHLSLSNLFLSISNFFTRLGEIRTGKHGFSIRSIIHRLLVLVIPLGIVMIFLTLYNVSSPYFNEVFSDTLDKIITFINEIDYSWVFVFVQGIFLSIFLLFRIASPALIEKDRNSSLLMARIRNKIRRSKPFRLKRELVAAQFLLVTLNVILLVVNLLDISNVWIGFEWNGYYLKQFVHEGTYVLIFSIIVSIGIVLWFFRGNINFYKKSSLLKTLAIVWMIQNIVLAVSVGIRNYWYIHYFALAYKRIGVLFFLLATLYGIYTVIIKIKNRQSAFYLFRNNTMAVLVVMLTISIFNWDEIIARYNFSHYKTAFIHYDFLVSLPDKTLPYLDKTKSELNEIDTAQQKLFRFPMTYMSSAEYAGKVALKKSLFKSRWENKGVLSWNYAEYKAYQELEKNKLKSLAEN